MAWTIRLNDNGPGREYTATVHHDAGFTKVTDAADPSPDKQIFTCNYTASSAGAGNDEFGLGIENEGAETGRLITVETKADGTLKARVGPPKPRVHDSDGGGPDSGTKKKARKKKGTVAKKTTTKSKARVRRK